MTGVVSNLVNKFRPWGMLMIPSVDSVYSGGRSRRKATHQWIFTWLVQCCRLTGMVKDWQQQIKSKKQIKC